MLCLSEALTTAGVHTDNSMLTHVKTQLYLSGILGHCVRVFTLDPKRLHGNWSAATTLAQLTRYISELHTYICR